MMQDITYFIQFINRGTDGSKLTFWDTGDCKYSIQHFSVVHLQVKKGDFIENFTEKM